MSGREIIMVRFRLKYPEEARLIDGNKYNHPDHEQAHNLWMAFRDGFLAGRKTWFTSDTHFKDLTGGQNREGM